MIAEPTGTVLTPEELTRRLDRFYRDRRLPENVGWTQCLCARWFRDEDFGSHVHLARRWKDGRPHGKRA